MLVRDIIKNTVWTPGTDYTSSRKPKISVLLPTYRRAKNGLFRKAVKSVLSQTVTDLELIIIDDASTDGTADQISEFMRRDGRVSCLRHVNNIGIPAVSELEAYLKARGDYIAFSFDDDFFYPDALARLLDEAEKHPSRVCYGTTIWRVRPTSSSEETIIRVGQPLSNRNLRDSNFIPNCGVLLPRRVIEDVGFYDPHILMLRICDWDLWRRIGERYLLHHVDVDVGEVTGPEQSDSLSRSVMMTAATSEERMRTQRKLRPSEILNLDVFDIDPRSTNASQLTTSDLREAHVAKRPWLGSPQIDDESSQDKLILVITDHYTASVTLCFDHLPDEIANRIRIVVSNQTVFSSLELAHVSCLIVIRRIDVHREWIEAASRLGIPTYYFLDDNFPELAKEGLPMPEDVSAATLRSKLRSFSGVLLSSKALCKYFDDHLIHQNIIFYPVSYARIPTRQIPRQRIGGDEWSADVTVATLGGTHRNQGFRDCVVPALQRIAKDGINIQIVLSDDNKGDEYFKSLEDENIRVRFFERQADWDRAIIQLGDYEPDILVHAPSETANAPYKTQNIAVCAYALDAVLVVPDYPPFDMEEFDRCAVKITTPDQPKSWLHGLKSLIKAREGWRTTKDANAEFCKREFSGETNVKVLREILRGAPVVRATAAISRLKELSTLRTSSPGSGVGVDLAQLRQSLLTLSSQRNRSLKSKLLMPWRRPKDLWPLVAPAFDEIKKHIQEHNLKAGALELSRSLHETPYVEFPIDVQPGMLLNFTGAFSSEGAHDGVVGVEVVDPSDEIIVQSMIDLRFVDFGKPVVFDLKKTIVSQNETWRFRIFARTPWPVYTFEFASYSSGGIRRRSIAPFARIDYAERKKSDT